MGVPGALVAGSLGKGKFNWGRALSWGLGGGLGGLIYEKKQGDKHRAAAARDAMLSDTDTPQVGEEEDKLKPGQRVNAINTSPQGVLSSASTGRSTLLGG